MAKGLPRSNRNAHAAQNKVVVVTIPVRNKVINVAAAGAGVGFGTGTIGDFPQGNILLIGAVANLKAAGPVSANLVDTFNGDFSVGSAPDANGSLASGEIDIIGSTALGPAVAEVTPVARGVMTAGNGPVILDNTDGSLEINLNVLIDAADITDASNVDLTFNGWVSLAYAILGDD